MGTRLKDLRTERGMTQVELAKQIGSTSKSIWAYENGGATPPLDVLIRYANYFNVSIDYLAGRSDELGTVVMPGAPQLTDEEEELLRLFRKLPAEYRSHELESLRMFAGEPMKTALPKKA